MRGRPAPGRRPPVGIILVAVVVTAIALFALVSVKVMLGQSAISSGDAEKRIQQKVHRLEQLQAEVARASSPAEISRRASEIGMIPASSIVPLRPAPPAPAAAGSGQGSR